MDIDTIYNEIEAHIATSSEIVTFGYDEGQADNEANETAYLTPAVWVSFGEAEQIGLFWKVPFDLRLEIKTLERTEVTLSSLNAIEVFLKAYKGANNERIHIKTVKVSKEKGNAPIHVFKCFYYQRV